MLKNLILTTLILTFIGMNAQAQQRLVLEGFYQGKNLFVQNPYKPDGIGFCAEKVLVNGDPTTDETASSAFEVDFKKLNIQQGDAVSVVIEYSGCDNEPKVINPEVLKPSSTCTFDNVKIDGNTLKWSTTNETGKLPFIIEIYNWNKWIAVGEVEGKGTPGENTYEFNLTPHSGQNQVRIKQVDHTKRPRMSKSVQFNANVDEISFSPAKVSKDLNFTAPTRYEIYDSYGNIVKKGFGGTVDCSNLQKGVYYLNYDNRNEKFIKK